MAVKHRAFAIDHPIVITFLIFAVIAFMSLAAEVLKPLALAILLSFALGPIAAFLERRGVPRFLSVVLTVLLALGALGFTGYKVGSQLTTLATHINRDQLEQNVRRKFGFLKPKQESTLEKLSQVGADIASSMDSPRTVAGTVPVNVISQPSFTQRLQSAVGPYLESAGVGAFVLILVLFILANREDLGDRIIRLAGTRQVSLTTKTMDEVGMRISRYLAMFATVNSAVGVIVGLGLWAIGVPLAALWGVLAALFRFIPYVGPASAFALPFLFSIATFPGWREPLMVVALFVTLEVLANSFFEPVIYGKTTGVSALGLLVAAMFWTWLWGAMGLLLSTPLTVCLAVLGKYVPALRVFATLLGEEAPLEPDVRFYQRLLAMDSDGASQIIDAALKQQPRAEVFDQVIVPTISRAERDYARDEIEDRDREFIRRFIGDLLDDLDVTPEVDLKSLAEEPNSAAGTASRVGLAEVRVLGVAASDNADALALRLLALLLKPSGLELTLLTETESPLKLAEQIADIDPRLVVLSHLPPRGFTTARYVVRRLRARFPDLPLLVGRWGASGDTETVETRLTEVGASKVVFHLADARDQILKLVEPRTDNASPVPIGAVPVAAPR